MDPRLAALYDPLDPDRSDLEVYLGIAQELGAQRMLDIGCGTGTLALLAAARGVEVTGLDPDAESLDIARAKPGSERVRWIHGDARAVPPELEVDLVTITGNAAQAIAGDDDWSATLAAAFAVLRDGGRLVFETRVPAREAWRGWVREQTHSVTDVEGVGPIENWVELVDVGPPLVTIRGTYVFPDGTTLTKDETLRFRERDEVERDLEAADFVVEDVRDAPDRPGLEFVFVAGRG